MPATLDFQLDWIDHDDIKCVQKTSCNSFLYKKRRKPKSHQTLNQGTSPQRGKKTRGAPKGQAQPKENSQRAKRRKNQGQEANKSQKAKARKEKGGKSRRGSQAQKANKRAKGLGGIRPPALNTKPMPQNPTCKKPF